MCESMEILTDVSVSVNVEILTDVMPVRVNMANCDMSVGVSMVTLTDMSVRVNMTILTDMSMRVNMVD